MMAALLRCMSRLMAPYCRANRAQPCRLSAEDQADRLPALVADLVRRQVALIVGNTTSALAAKAATTTLPIVFVTGNDPVINGLVASLSRPGGNMTGVSFLSSASVTKRLELLRQLAPKAAAIAMLGGPELEHP